MATKEELSFDLNGDVDAEMKAQTQGAGTQHWVTYRHPGYADMKTKWDYVSDHYTADLLLSSRIADYLLIRSAAEHDKAWEERRDICAYTPHLAAVIDSMVGMMESVDGDTERVFQPDGEAGGLGDHEEPGTPANRLWFNIDGSGTNWKAFWQRVATELTKFQEVYVLVEGIRRSDEAEEAGDTSVAATTQEPRVRLIVPSMVTNVRYDDSGRMVEAVVRHRVDTRKSIEDKPKTADRYTVYRLTGYEVWQRQSKTSTGRSDFIQIDNGAYAYYDGPDQNHRILPIFQVRLPMSRHVAYIGARLANRIFNTESERQMGTRMGNIARFAVVGGKEQFKQVVDYIKKGGTLIQHWPDQATQHYYITPPTQPADTATTQISEYTENFYAVMFSQFADASKQVTATQIRQESRSGVEAFLTLLSDAVDEAENGALLRLEQTEYPDTPTNWAVAYVKRSKDFAPVDSELQIANMRDRYFPGKPVPIGETGKTEAAKRIAQYDGIPVEDDEIEVEAVIEEEEEAIDEDALNAFGL